DLEDLVRRAGLQALREDLEAKEVPMRVFEAALKETRASVTPEVQREYEEIAGELKRESPTRRVGVPPGGTATRPPGARGARGPGAAGVACCGADSQFFGGGGRRGREREGMVGGGRRWRHPPAPRAGRRNERK